jgi:hypothetical protein
MPFGAALTNDDIAWNNMFTAEFFNAEASSGTIATVTG